MTETVAHSLVRILREAAVVLGDRTPEAPVRLARRLGGAGCVARVHPAEALEAPDPERIAAHLSGRLMLEAACELSTALWEAGVPHFFVKGVALLGRVYRPGEREIADIDLHVIPELRDEAVYRAGALGFQPVDQSQQDGPDGLRPGVALARGVGPQGLARIVVDLRWGLDPVERILPRPDHPVPRVVWDRLDRSGSLPVPSDASHAALIIHHLVHHDLLHYRGLVDLALLWDRLDGEGGSEVQRVAEQLRVGRAARTLGEVLASEFGLTRPAGLDPAPSDWRGIRGQRVMEPVRWCLWAVTAPAAEEVTVTPRRMARRLLFLDSMRAARHLLRDAVWPPREWLEWRWPEAGSGAAARVRHAGQLFGKLRSGGAA